MLPKKIQMKNFGPYVDECVNFEDLQADGLFLITGDTGAGKTTILDAMTFALYGRVTSDKRTAQEMRSHFAELTAKTEVQFTFSHQNYTYKITRQPKMYIPQKNGKEKKVDHNVHLEIFDENLQLVDNLSSITDVNKFVDSLLHLTSEQFSQIMLLPQGKFQEFLLSNSSNKSDILRTIFNTQFYRQLTDIVKENYKQKEKTINRQVDQLHQLSAQFQFAQEEKLENQENISLESWPIIFAEDLSIQNNRLNIQKNTLQEQNQLQTKLQDELQLVQELTKKQAEGERLIARQAQLIENEPKMIELSETIEYLKWFAQQKHDLEQYEKEKQKYQDAVFQLTDTKSKQSDNEVAIQRFDQQQDLRVTWQANLQQAQQKKYQLEELLPIAKEYAEKLQDFQMLKAKTEDSLKHVQELEQSLSDKNEAIVQTEASLNQCNQQIQQFSQVSHEVGNLQDWLNADSQKQKVLKQQHLLQKKQPQIEKQIEEENQKLQKIQGQIEEQRQVNVQLLSARLRRLLKPGEPCPVCGSIEHPSVTHDTAAEQQALIENEQALQQLEIQLQTCQKQQGALSTQKLENEHQLVECAQQIDEYTQKQDKMMVDFFNYMEDMLSWEAVHELKISPITATTIKNFRQQFRQTLDDLMQQSQTMQAQLTHEKTDLKQLQDSLIQAQTENQALQKQWVQSESQLNSYQARLGDQNYTVLKEKSLQVEQEIKHLSEQLEQAQHQEKNLQDTKIRLDTQVQSLQTFLAQQEEIVNQAKRGVVTIYQQIDLRFGSQIYVAWKKGEEVNLSEYWKKVAQLPVMEQTWQHYQEEKHYLATRLQELAEILEKPTVDVKPLEEQLVEMKQNIEELSTQYAQDQLIYEQNNQLCQRYNTLLAQNQQMLTEVQAYARLAKGMNGDNELKLTLENYCLQVYFQEVLLLANQRLQELTQGRYTLEISDEKGRTASNTGLELVIFDDYTGEIRRVQTLSGGESFIVSLALSLSLADVIQRQSGGVQIEALFIDEGFGTLDEQTLQLAIQTLAQLEGQGQMIGIISHVRELKEQIPRQIQVKKLGDGRSEIRIHSEGKVL